MGLFTVVKRALSYERKARALPHVLMAGLSPAREVIATDMARWIQEWHHDYLWACPSWKRTTWLVWKYPEFRSLVYFRVQAHSHWPSRLLLPIARRLYPGRETLYFSEPSIGPGLFIEHGHSTDIGAKSIGANCWINQQVTIGNLRHGEEAPVIGNNVRIAVGAKVLGAIEIGDNCIIGANSLVCRDVPPNCTVVGVPAYIIRRDGRMVRPRFPRR